MFATFIGRSLTAEIAFLCVHLCAHAALFGLSCELEVARMAPYNFVSSDFAFSILRTRSICLCESVLASADFS